MRSRSSGSGIAFGFIALVGLAAVAAAQDVTKDVGKNAAIDSTRTVWDGVYSAQQAERGRQTYRRTCAKCHLTDLSGGAQSGGADGEVPPPLAGPEFAEQWNGRPLSELFLTMKRGMPLDTPGALPSETYADLVSYVLKMNGMPAGATDVPTDTATLERIRITGRP
jgi:S-disulfanyl-L-cysteine oxidoreductase SoxD